MLLDCMSMKEASRLIRPGVIPVGQERACGL